GRRPDGAAGQDNDRRRDQRRVRRGGERRAAWDPRGQPRRARVFGLQERPPLVDRGRAVDRGADRRLGEGCELVRQRVGVQLSHGRPDLVHGGAALKASINSVDVAGKRVLVREDLNVPMSNGAIADDARVRAAAPTLRHRMKRRARVIVMSHLGRPKDREPDLSLRPIAAALSRNVGREDQFAEDCVGAPATTAVERLLSGQLLLLENVRYHKEDEANDTAFARDLASLGDLFVNDAFAASHRAHASVVGVAAYLPAFAGELMEAELDALHKALDNPRRPMVAVVGGAKVSTKVGVLRSLLEK